MEKDELAAWLRLTLSPGVGTDAARKLLAAFGLPQAVFMQTASALQQVVSPAHARALLTEPPKLAELLDTTWSWLQAPDPDGCGRVVLTLADACYPSGLLAMADPPLMLYLLGACLLRGNVSPAPVTPLQTANKTITHSLSRCIAMVGTRNPTPQGTINARQFAQHFSAAGLTVVSGLALGIDGAAHEGALAGASEASDTLATIAVVGTGLDRVYPRRHLALAHQIAQRGLIVSEYPLGTPPLPGNFPKRNRIIAGLSLGTLVVEAAQPSGSLITARLAAEQGKEVFAIPGSIHAPQSRGCHALIKQGAKLVESAQDVLEELQLPGTTSNASPPTHGMSDADIAPDDVLDALGFDATGLDALVARTGIDAAALQVRLLELELDGYVARLPGGLFQRMGTA